MLSDFKLHIDQKFPFLNHSKLLLAVSGGIDSVVLTHLLKELYYDIALAHVNFQLRADESDADEQFVKDLGEKLNLQIFTHHVDTEKEAKENGISIQMAARDIRYQWFSELMQEHEFDFLLTAHHLDDNIETFFINLNRKSGLLGLTGIPAQNENIIRPLLPFSRKELEQYAQENDLIWREDQSNATLKYERNQIRHELIPVLEKINPEFRVAFQQSFQFLNESNQLIQDYISLVKSNFWTENEHEIEINTTALQALPNYESILYETLKDFHFTDWIRIFDLVHGQSGKEIHSETHKLIKDRNRIIMIQKTNPSKEEKSTESEMETTPKESNFYDAVFKPQVEKNISKSPKKRIQQTEIVKTFIKDGIQVGDLSYQLEVLKNENNINFKKRGIEYFDADMVSFPLYIKPWQHGDFFFPLGMNGRKKLSDYFMDIKLSVLEKEKIWLLCDSNDQILWVIGYRIDNRFKVTEHSKNLIKIVPVS